MVKNLSTVDIKSDFSRLNADYLGYVALVVKVSDTIYGKLEEYYTEERIRKFTNFDQFLEDINDILETGSSAKLRFINNIKKKYY